jgi:hypothetical protein
MIGQHHHSICGCKLFFAERNSLQPRRRVRPRPVQLRYVVVDIPHFGAEANKTVGHGKSRGLTHV